MSELRRHSHSVSSDLPVNNTCHGCIANARELVEARRKIDDLTRAAERNAGLAEVETTRFANERLSIELDEMKQIAEQLAWLMQDVLSVLADNFRQKADTETLGSALLTCLAPAKGFGTSLKNHYEQFEDAVGGNIDFETSPPTVHESRPSVQHASCFGDPESSTSPSGATRRYPEFSSLLGYALGGTRHQPPGSDHSSTSLSTEDHHLTVDPKPSAIPSPTHIRAEIGVPTDEEVPAIRPVGADSEKLDAFLDNLRRESFRGSSRPSVLSDEEDERDHEVGLFLDSVITRPTSGRASVPGIVPPAFLTSRAATNPAEFGNARAHVEDIIEPPPPSSVPVCHDFIDSGDGACEDESLLDSRLIAAMYNAELNKAKSEAPGGASDKKAAAADSTETLFSALELTKKVYFDEQVQFRFPDFPARFDGELMDVELRSDIKYFDGRSLYALAGGCSSLWANPSRCMLDKIVTWMTTASLEVPQHRHRSRSYASPEDMSTDGYLL